MLRLNNTLMEGADDDGAAGGAPAGGEAEGAPAANWTDGLSDEYKGLVAAKGWQDVGAALESYRNLEAMRGVPGDRLITIPADGESYDDVYGKLGRPESPDGYSLESAPAGMVGDDATDFIKGTAHELGLNQSQLTKLTEKIGERNLGIMEANENALKDRINEDHKALRKEWGAAHDQKIDLARRAMVSLAEKSDIHFEDSELEQLEETLGYAKLMKMFSAIGGMQGEDDYVGDNSGAVKSFNMMSPAEATHRIETLKSDPAFRKKLVAGDPAATDEWHRLHRFQTGGE